MIALPTFPLTLYHPIHGRRTADTHADALVAFQPISDWWPTAEEADAHRTQAEADVVAHATQRGQVDEKDAAGIVLHSVQYQAAYDRKMEDAKAAEAAARQSEAEAGGEPVTAETAAHATASQEPVAHADSHAGEGRPEAAQPAAHALHDPQPEI